MAEKNRRERFQLVYQACYHRILGYALRRTEAPEDAADVVAETFLVAWRRFDDLPQGDAVLWLYGVARRVLANHRRGERRRSRLAERLRDEVSDVQGLREPTVSEELEAVVQALALLREGDREILGLVAWEGLSHEQLGNVLGCSPNAAKIRLHMARRRLAAQLAEASTPVKRVKATGHAEGEGVAARPAMEEEW